MLQREIDAETAADIAKFEQQLERYLAGDLAEDVFRVFRLNNGIYGQRQGGHQPDGPHQGALRRHHRRAARHAGPHRRDLLAGLGPHHHPPERAVPLRRARAGPRGHAPAGLGRAHHPRGLRRHRAQRHGLPPGRRLPVRGLRHQPLGRGRLPALPAPPVRPAPAPQVQDQLLGLRHRLRPGHVQRRRAWWPPPAPSTDGTVEQGFRVFIAGGLGANPHPALALEEFTAKEDLLPTIESVLRVFEQTGNRDNKLRARLKWVVDELGFDEVQRRVFRTRHTPAGLVELARRHPRGRPEAGRRPGRRGHRRHPHRHRPGHARWPCAAPSPTSAGSTPTSCAAWPRARSRPSPGPGWATSPPTSSGRWPRSPASSGLEVRLTNRQNICFRGLTEAQLPTLFARLDAIGMAAARRRAGPRRRGLPRRRHLQPGRDPVPGPGRRHRRGPRGGRPGRGGRRAHQHLRLHQLVRPAPRRRHRLLRRRAPGPRPVRPRLPDAARRLRRARSRWSSARRPCACRPATPPRPPCGWCAGSPSRAPGRRGLPRLDRALRRRGRHRRRPQGPRPVPHPDEAPDFYVDFGETGPYVAEIGESECAT